MTSDLPHPRENPHLFGHLAAEQTLLDAYNSGKLPHGWLITGARGLGKATLAYRFARFLLAQDGGQGAGSKEQGGLFGDALPPDLPTSLAVVEDHPTFRRIVAEGHADLTVIEPTNLDEDSKEKASWEIRVWQVRKLAKFLHQTTAESAWRIVIIDPVDEMNPNAANALLKLLEEPPANTVLMLISHNPGRLLPTIRSRCRVLNLRPLGEGDVGKVLQGFGEQVSGFSDNLLPETQNPEPETLFAITLADGSPGLAAEIHAQGGLELYGEMLEALQSLPKFDAVAVQDFGAGFGKKDSENRWQLMTMIFGWFLGSTVRMGVTGASLPEFFPHETELRQRLLHHCGIDRLAELWQNTSRTVAIGDALHQDRQQTFMEIAGQLQAS